MWVVVIFSSPLLHFWYFFNLRNPPKSERLLAPSFFFLWVHCWFSDELSLDPDKMEVLKCILSFMTRSNLIFIKFFLYQPHFSMWGMWNLDDLRKSSFGKDAFWILGFITHNLKDCDVMGKILCGISILFLGDIKFLDLRCVSKSIYSCDTSSILKILYELVNKTFASKSMGSLHFMLVNLSLLY